jgi:predicted MFS family arabinose efflux permease
VIGPFQQAILPDLVPPSEFLAAVSLNSAQFNLGRVIGPALAGVTIAAFGYPVAFVANAVSFLAVVLALFFVRLSPPSGRSERVGLFTSLRTGARAAWIEPGCRASIVTIAVVALLASPFIALVPVMAHRLSNSGARGIASATGLLTTAQGLGAVAGALAMAPLAARLGRGRLLIGSLALLPPALVAYGFAPSLAFALPALFAVGLVYIGVLSGLSTVVQLRAPSEVRGRVLSLYLVALGVSYPVGSLIQGPLADRVGLAWTTAGTAALLAVVLLAARVFRPGLLRTLAGPAPKEPISARASL